MFGYLFGRNRGGTSPSEQPEIAAAEETAKTGIRYDPSLISELKSDHSHLVSLFQDIAAITGKRDARLVTKQLDEFGDKLRGHLLKENVRFYVYLKSNLPDGSNLAMSQDFAREMQQIGRVVTNFLHKYTNVEQWEDAHWPAFESELAAIGRVLTQRIESEESTLYPLYLPPGENQ